MIPFTNWVADRLNILLRPVGMALVRRPAPAERRRRALMRSNNISVVVDIGANIGQYGYELRSGGYRGRIQSYEPLPQEYRTLLKRCRKDPRWQAHNLAVDASPGVVTMHVAGNSESSSLLPMLQRHVDAARHSAVKTQVAVPTITLGHILSELRDETVMLKIDTQGNERRVLDGGEKVLRTVRLIEIELSLVALYQGQSLFREIDSFLLQHGFTLASLQEGFFDEATGELLQMDAIYANSDLSPLATNEGVS
jgi:FkbM family methyltransferase